MVSECSRTKSFACSRRRDSGSPWASCRGNQGVRVASHIQPEHGKIDKQRSHRHPVVVAIAFQTRALAVANVEPPGGSGHRHTAPFRPSQGHWGQLCDCLYPVKTRSHCCHCSQRPRTCAAAPPQARTPAASCWNYWGQAPGSHETALVVTEQQSPTDRSWH